MKCVKFVWFPTFLVSHFITQWPLDIQMGHRISQKTRGFRSRCLRPKYILENDTPTQYSFRETEEPSCFSKSVTLFMFVYDFVVYPPPHSPGRGRTWQELDFWLRIDSRVELIDRLQCSCLVSINIAQYIQLSRWPRGNRRNAVDTDRVTTFLAPSLKMVWVGWGGVGHSIYWQPWQVSNKSWNTSTIENFIVFHIIFLFRSHFLEV